MKKLLLTLLSIAFCSVVFAGMNIPEPTGYVVDTINLLNPVTKLNVEELCKNVEPHGQIAVLIVGTTQPYSIEEYSIKVAEKWKVGYFEQDNGVILLVAKEDRKVRIEVGRGIEDKITDSKAGTIIRNNIVPYFKNGDFNRGVLEGVKAIKTEVMR